MPWNVEAADEYVLWWNGLSEAEQISVDAYIRLVEHYGPALTRPYSDTVKNSKHKNMKELRVQHQGKPYRILYAFDPKRTAILLIGGNKTGKKRWYDTFISIADQLFDEHLKDCKE